MCVVPEIKEGGLFSGCPLRAGARGEVIDHLCLVSNTVQKHCAKLLSYLKHLLERGAARGKY